jgi:uncharacterized protein YkwD
MLHTAFPKADEPGQYDDHRCAVKESYVSGRISRRLACLAVAAAAAPAIAACTPFVTPMVPRHPDPAPITQPTSKPTSTPTKPVTPPSDASAYESRILVLVNSERAKQGLRSLTLVSCADGFANSWAATLAQTGNFVHQSLSPIMTGCSARGAGENIAYGNVSADAMMTMWMDSPGHRANILNASYTGIGIGALETSSGRWYGVQDFITQ